MCSLTVSVTILLTLAELASATETAVNDKSYMKDAVDTDQGSVESVQLAHHFVDKLVSRMLTISTQNCKTEECDTLNTATFAKSHPGKTVGIAFGTAVQPMIPRKPIRSLVDCKVFASSCDSSSVLLSSSIAKQVQTVQGNLKTYGIGSSQLQKSALTWISVANRRKGDVSVRAQNEIRSAYSDMDGTSKQNFLKVIDQVKAKESMMAGITAPLDFFDPIGFSTKATAGKLLFYREVELKHGRVAMLASLGLLAGEEYHPLFGGNIDVPSAFAFQETPLQAFWPLCIIVIGAPELLGIFSWGSGWSMNEDHTPGDLGFDPLGLKPKDPEEFKNMQTKELNNGRLAMIAAAGIVAQEVATGEKIHWPELLHQAEQNLPLR